MENTVSIEPASDEIKTIANAVRIKNEFLRKGISKRVAFKNFVVEILPEFSTPDKIALLDGFWLLRVKDDKINRDLEIVLEQLKSE